MANKIGERPAGILLLLTGVASLALLAAHPGETATNFAGVLKEEAANRSVAGVVHGGYIAVLVLQIIGYARLSDRLDLRRLLPLAGIVFFAAGALFLSASLLLDGLVIPALATRYADAPAKIESARSLFVFCETAIGFLMPIGLAFQGSAVASWGAALWRSSRIVGAVGILFGLGMLGALAANIARPNPVLLIGSLIASTLWAFVATWPLLRKSS
jgi:MFS family permease